MGEIFNTGIKPYTTLLWNLSFEVHLTFVMNHVRFMISPELCVVQETLAFVICDSY
jgi:hypothetical protein